MDKIRATKKRDRRGRQKKRDEILEAAALARWLQPDDKTQEPGREIQDLEVQNIAISIKMLIGLIGLFGLISTIIYYYFQGYYRIP